MFDFFEESWLVCWSFCEFFFKFLIIDLATVVCVCKWFVGTPSFHHMLFLYDVLANMWDPFVMFSSDHLLITKLKPLVDCPCIVPAFVFHQRLIFQMFFWNQMTFSKNLDLFVEVFFEILFTFLIIDLENVVCVCKWFVGTPSFIICCSFLSWRTCETLLWCSLVTTFWSLTSNSLLFVHVSFQLLFFISLWYFRCFFAIRWLFWRILTSLLKFLWNFIELFDHRSWNRRLCL